jgi:hypothetical protein
MVSKKKQRQNARILYLFTKNNNIRSDVYTIVIDRELEPYSLCTLHN